MRFRPQQPGDPRDNHRFRWQLNLRLMLLVAMFLPLTIALGFWQLDRAEGKRLILETHRARQAAQAVPLGGITAEGDNQYRRIRQSGTFDNRRTLLLDNRIRRGRPGYEVISLFKADGSEFWLAVNRGWLAGGLDRSVLPPVPPVDRRVAISGYLYRVAGEPLVLGQEQWRATWPKVVQNLDLTELARQTGLTIFPWQLRLEPGSAGTLATGWPVVNVAPDRHLGYAAQWFALALTLVILAIFANSNLAQVLGGRKNASGGEAAEGLQQSNAGTADGTNSGDKQE